MPTPKSKISEPESWDESTKNDPESWTSQVDELGEIQREALDEIKTKKFGVVISPIFKTASGGERIQINKGAMKAYDEDNRIVWQLLQNTNDNILTLNKRDDDGYGNALNIQDDSDDGNASLNIEYTGNSATKDLIHLELAATMTQARVGISTELEAGTVEALYSGHAKAGTASHVAYFESDLAAGKVLSAWTDNASNSDPTCWLRNDRVQNTKFYGPFMLFDGAGVRTVKLYIANGDSPNGTLTASAGDLCFGTNGVGDGLAEVCNGGTNWTSMV